MTTANVNRSQAIRDYKKSHPSVESWKAVQEALATDGIKVSDALCQKVYYEKAAGKKKAAKPAKKEAAPKKKATKKPKAKKLVRGAKSQAIRDYYAANKDASAKECVAALKSKGLKVSDVLVHNVRFGMRKKLASVARRGRGPLVAKNRRNKGTKAAFTLEHLLEAKNFVKAIGDQKSAVQLIETLELLKS